MPAVVEGYVILVPYSPALVVALIIFDAQAIWCGGRRRGRRRSTPSCWRRSRDAYARRPDLSGQADQAPLSSAAHQIERDQGDHVAPQRVSWRLDAERSPSPRVARSTYLLDPTLGRTRRPSNRPEKTGHIPRTKGPG